MHTAGNKMWSTSSNYCFYNTQPLKLYFLHLNRRQRRTRCKPRLEEGSGSWRIFWPEGAKHRKNRSHQSSHWTIVVITVVIRLGRLFCPFPGATASVCISFPLLSPRGNLHCTLDNNLPIIIKFIDLPPLHSPHTLLLLQHSLIYIQSASILTHRQKINCCGFITQSRPRTRMATRLISPFTYQLFPTPSA